MLNGLKNQGKVLPEKASELTAKQEEVAKATSEVKKLVKLDLPKESWKELGITDRMPTPTHRWAEFPTV